MHRWFLIYIIAANVTEGILSLECVLYNIFWWYLFRVINLYKFIRKLHGNSGDPWLSSAQKDPGAGDQWSAMEQTWAETNYGTIQNEETVPWFGKFIIDGKSDGIIDWAIDESLMGI